MQQPSLQRNEIFTSVNYRCRASLLPGICLTTAGRAPCKLRGATLLGMQNPTLQQCKLLRVQIHEPLRMSYSYVSPPGLRAALHRSPTSPSQEGVGLADARKPFTLRARVFSPETLGSLQLFQTSYVSSLKKDPGPLVLFRQTAPGGEPPSHFMGAALPLRGWPG